MWWTLLAAIIASITATGIAVFVYPWQKRVEREAEILRERREKYADLIVAILSIRNAVEDRKIGSSVDTYNNAAHVAFLYASNAVSEAIKSHTQIIIGMVDALEKTLNSDQSEQYLLDKINDQHDDFLKLSALLKEDLSHQAHSVMKTPKIVSPNLVGEPQ